MSYEEAVAWLKDERSSINYAPGDSHAEAVERSTRMDAAMTEQAYWVVRAYQERLIPQEPEGDVPF